MGVLITAKTEKALKVLEKLQAGLTAASVDAVVENVAVRSLARLIEKTPKKWFGQVRRGWLMQKPRAGVRYLVNPNKIMGYLERGTANEGRGYIYPVKAKALFIPLSRRAVGATAGVFGVVPGGRSLIQKMSRTRGRSLIWGVDYILAKRVRGIKPRRIVAKEKRVVARELHTAFKTHIRQIIR